MTRDSKERSDLVFYFQDYATAHQTRGNVISHLFGIPMIIVSLLGMLSQIVFVHQPLLSFPLFQVDLAVLLICLAQVFYLPLDWKLGFPYFLALIGLYFLGRTLPLSADLVLFAAGWILQGIGHGVYEKNKPAFFQTLIHLLVGPLWIFAKAIGYKP